MLEKSAVEEKILQILEKKLGCRIECLTGEGRKENFFGLKLSLSAREMVYLCCFLEEEYGVSFEEEDMREESFYTLGGMAQVVAQKLKEPVCQ